MKFYQISKIVIRANYSLCNIQDWDKFSINCDYNRKALSINFEEKKYVGELETYIFSKDMHYFIRYMEDIMLVNNNWTKATLLPLRDQEGGQTLIRMLFYTQAVQRQMIQFHSSLIDYKGHGFMFLGPSGIGKTTQAELWKKFRDALIINGDIVFVEETLELFLGWGTPWHGSSPYCENASVPVKALIVLKKAPKNSIRELTGFEKVTAVSNNVFYPRWIENGVELCLETLDHLLSRIPVYELSCRPDEDAVKLTEETVFGNEL